MKGDSDSPAGVVLPRHRVLRALAIALCLLVLVVLTLDRLFPLPLPRRGDMSVLVTARDGRPLRAFADAGGVWRHPATPDTVSPLYLEALLGYEDRWFWRHPGINPFALGRAGWQVLRAGRIVSGGSTLTMQVARLIDPHSRSLGGKFKQMLRALQLEAHLSKREILTLYLERAPYGGVIEGVDTASWAYLGKPASELSHAEAALLAVLPQSPSRLRPDRAPEAARRARDKLLARMAALGLWTEAEVEDARIEPVVARSLQPPLVAALLAERLRREHPGEARIVSTLDIDLQRALEARVRGYFARLPPRTSAALLVIDNRTMEARAYVGSVAYGDKARLGHIDMVRAVRSPGSTLKPFLYGLALDDGLIHSESLFVDAPQAFGGYRPGNFGEDFHGPVSAADALRMSLNVPAVALLEQVGPARFAARLDNAGLALRLPAGAKPNLAMILGGVGTRLDDLLGAYAALQRGGVAGRVRYVAGDRRRERRLLSPGAAWIVREMLQANPRPGAVMGVSASRHPVAWKTGTSYGYRDAWALGSTPDYSVGLWVGRPDGTPLPGQYGAVTALPLMFEVIDTLPRPRRSPPSTVRPIDVEAATICWPLGTAPEPAAPALCRQRRQAWILNGGIPPTFPERESRGWNSLRERLRVDAVSGQRLSADCRLPHEARIVDVARWPALAAPWLDVATRRAARLPPLAADCVDDGRERALGLRIDGIVDGSRLAAPPGEPGHIGVSAPEARGQVQWLLDGRWVGSSRDGGEFRLPLDMPAGRHSLTAMAENGAWARLEFERIVVAAR
ncbi:penicillin-binding protein 1C [Lysobacter pythonis]|uniref:peptidoglycan glycosyltransferase n=1 Tax=Solilutibacter pythonis TaxID=2483112 RepID=A0A3M2HN14_9GAMM|nr:penicillin-binding protein 1C [Lysobacter pythonis]RMH91096.1 penicillin-binding protein 1C [Lysobacter pythonis]